MKSQGFRQDLLSLALLAVLSLAMTYPLILHMGDHVASDVGDPLYTLWLMAWTLREHGRADANIFYPHHGTLYYADILPALSLLASPVVALSGNYVLAYNALFIFSFFLCGAGLYLLSYRLVGSRPAAFVAAVVFAFFPYRFAHISHLEILYFCWMPMCFYFLHRFFEEGRSRHLVGAGLFYVLQVYSCAYYGVFFTLFAGLFILYFGLAKGLFRKPGFWVRMAVFALSCSALLFPFFLTYYRIHQTMRFSRPIWEVNQFSAQVQSFLAVPPWNKAWGWLSGRWASQEGQLYPGIIVVALALVFILGLRRQRTADGPASEGPKQRPGYLVWDIFHFVFLALVTVVFLTGGARITLGGIKFSMRGMEKPLLLLCLSLLLRVLLDKTLRGRLAAALRRASLIQRFYLLALLLGVLLCFGPKIRFLDRVLLPGPYGLLYGSVPGFQGLRVPGRFFVVAEMALALLAAWGLKRMLEKRSFAKPGLAVSAVCLLILADYFSAPLPLAPLRVNDNIPPVYEAVKTLPETAVLLELPMPERDAEEFRDALPVYYSLFHRHRIVNGYSGYAPPGYRVIREAMETFPSPQALDLLARLGVDHVLIHTQGYRAEKGKAFLRKLNKRKRAAQRVAESQGDYLFRLQVEAKPLEPVPPYEALSRRSLWSAQSSKNLDLAPLAFDGNPSTGWTTGYPQQKGDFFALDLGEVLSPDRLEISLDTVPLDFPRGFELEGSLDGRSWTLLRAAPEFFPRLSLESIENLSAYSVEITWEPRPVRFLRMTLSRGHEGRHWSIQEIRVLSRPPLP